MLLKNDLQFEQYRYRVLNEASNTRFYSIARFALRMAQNAYTSGGFTQVVRQLDSYATNHPWMVNLRAFVTNAERFSESKGDLETAIAIAKTYI